jgi:hypothetical protein
MEVLASHDVLGQLLDHRDLWRDFEGFSFALGLLGEVQI